MSAEQYFDLEPISNGRKGLNRGLLYFLGILMVVGLVIAGVSGLQGRKESVEQITATAPVAETEQITVSVEEADPVAEAASQAILREPVNPVLADIPNAIERTGTVDTLSLIHI